jgi:flavin-dependent thymidylate synthase
MPSSASLEPMAEENAPMARPSVPEADAQIGVKHPVLAHGFVVLVDYMGNDAAIVQAARVSYGQGTKSLRDDRGLVRYLMRHRHTTPFEMVEFKFLVRLPIYVARQWIRHRTACLAEGSRVHLEVASPGAGPPPPSGPVPIESLWREAHGGTGLGGSLERSPNGLDLRLHHLDESAQRFDAVGLVDVYRNGVKPVVRMVLADGKSIECTPDHRFLFSDGWHSLREGAGVSMRPGTVRWDREAAPVAVNGAPDRIPTTGGAAVVRPRFVPIERFDYVGPRMTYDLEVAGPHHNFVANGIVTHNSVNEYSARYSIVPDEFALPGAAEIRTQSTRNRQSGDEPAPGPVAQRFREDLERISTEAYEAYTRALEAGVARETARIVLPVAYYTQWYWKINLHNLFHFLSLRLDPHAQEEIRRYSVELAKLARAVAPVAIEAFEEFQLEGISLSQREQQAVRALLSGDTPEGACRSAGLPLTREDGRPMTSGEGVEFLEKLERIRSTS